MAIHPHVCKRHGDTTAYVCKSKARGRVVRVVCCRDCRREDVQRQVARVREQIIAGYGGACVCCGEREPRFLTIDHSDGNGHAERKSGLRGFRLYASLIKRGFPKAGYRLLCFNCNCSRGQFGKCPHES